MESGFVALRRLIVSNYKSIKQAELDPSENLVLLMGPNNAGKSNLVDALVFLRDAGLSLPDAFASRGGEFSSIAHRKQSKAIVGITIETSVPEELRAECLEELFAHRKRPHPKHALAPEFLSTLCLKVELGTDRFTETLSVPHSNKAGSTPLVLFKSSSAPEGIDFFGGQLEAFAHQNPSERTPEPVRIASTATQSVPWRLPLGRPECAEEFPISEKLAALVHNTLSGLQWIGPSRGQARKVVIQGHREVLPDASNLPDVLHWLNNNHPRKFQRIESELRGLIPRLGRLYTPTERQETTLGLIEGEDDDELAIGMEQMSYGTRSAVAIVTKLLMADPGTWVCVEEPETHLHPQAQAVLLEFLRRQASDKQILVTTHSTAIAASVPLESLFVVERDGSYATVPRPATPGEAHHLVDLVGVQPSFDFQADALVFVEDACHAKAIEVWARAVSPKPSHKIQFLDAESGNTLKYYANTRVALSPHVHTPVLMVLTEADASLDELHDQIRSRLLAELKLPADHLVDIPGSEIEGRFLDHAVISRAFPKTATSSPEDFERLLDRLDREQPPKTLLDSVLRESRCGGYNPQTAAKLAEGVREVPQIIRDLLARIERVSQPYWAI